MDTAPELSRRQFVWTACSQQYQVPMLTLARTPTAQPNQSPERHLPCRTRPVSRACSRLRVVDVRVEELTTPQLVAFRSGQLSLVGVADLGSASTPVNATQRHR